MAPGNWSVAAIPAATSIAPGKYFLIELATGGAVGIALPTPDLINTTINISNTAGKIALVNNTTPLNGTTACADASVIDAIGYGAAATCSETAVAVTTGIDNTQSQFRSSNGCTDTNNNGADFSVAAVDPRNSSSAANNCGPASPLLTALPGSLAIFSSVGIPSIEQSFTLSGTNLTGFPGNITVTASVGLQVSLSSGAGFATSVNVGYSSATLINTTVYVRIAATAPQGVLSGTVTCSGGGAASNAVVSINGGVYQNYYNTRSNSGLNNLNTWSDTPGGSGTSPTDFTSAYQVFNIINEVNANYTGVWNVTGAGGSSRVVVGDGLFPLSFTILPGADSLTMATKVDVLDQATLIIQNNRRPFLNNLATGSTVDFTQAGTTTADTIRIPNISFYNLKLTGGLKYFNSSVTTVRGNLVVDGVVSMNGSSPNFSTINALGNVSFINGSQFEPMPSGDAARITLAMNGNTNQAITGQQNFPLRLFRLQRDSINANDTIDLQAELILGNAAGGGLRLAQGPSTSTILKFNFPFFNQLTLIGAGIITPTSMGKINSAGGNITIAKTGGNSNAGILRFISGAYLNGLTLNFGPGFARDSILIADSIRTQGLTLTKGRAVLLGTSVLNVGPVSFIATTADIFGGSSASFVDGKLRRDGFLDNIDHNRFPVGDGDKYAPILLNNGAAPGGISVQYFFNGYGNYTIDPTTLSTYPDYNVSRHEYWTVENAFPGFLFDLSFYYTDARSHVINPPQVKMAHFDGTDWNDIGGTADAANTISNGFVSVAGITDFSPFTFSARITGVLPVRLSSFTAQKANKAVQLKWSTSQEINSSRFVVQRSTDGRTWKDILSVPAAGNSSSRIDYAITDERPESGLNFYRLKQVNIDEKFDYSETRSVLFSIGFDVTVTPNPAHDFIKVYISKDNNASTTIILNNANGQEVKTYTTKNLNLTIPCNHLPAGIYFVRIINEGNIISRKIIVY